MTQQQMAQVELKLGGGIEELLVGSRNVADLAPTRTGKSPARGHANCRHADAQIAGTRTG